MFRGSTPASSISQTIRSTMTRVFPEPAPAKTSAGPSPVLTAARDHLRAALEGEVQMGDTAREALQGVVASLDVQFIEGADLAVLGEEEP